MQIVLVTSSITAVGGAAKSMREIANYFASEGCVVTVVTMAAEKPRPVTLDSRVHCVALNLLSPSSSPIESATNVARRFLRIRSELRRQQPDVVISFFCWINVLSVLACEGRAPVIVSERGVPAREEVGVFWRRLRPVAYRRAHSVVTLTREAADFFSPDIQAKAHVIPISIGDQAPEGLEKNDDSKIVVGMGRLAPEKGFDNLIRAFAISQRKHPDWSLRIYGEGRMRAELEALISQLDLRKRVTLMGVTREPLARLAEGAIFAHAPSYEGFGYVYLEAMLCGLPVVSYAAPGGPNEIVRHKKTGLLTPPGDVESLAAGLTKLMESKDLRASMGKLGQKEVQRFSPQSEMAAWSRLVHQAHGFRRRGATASRK